MNLKKYYPYTPIYTVEENENTIIIYTTTPEEEMKTVYDLPMCGKQVIIKISTDIIDDISSYFDSNRKESILNYLEKRNIQVLVSSTGDLGIDSNDFYVEGGEIVYDTKAE